VLNVVVLNGGRGAATLIPALLRVPGVKLTSVVNAYDDGKSTGEIRRFFGMLGPSDLRKVQSHMLPAHAEVECALFDYRFPDTCGRDEAMEAIAAFCAGADRLAGIGPIDPRTGHTLRAWLAEFLAGLPIAETMLGRPFDFRDCSLMNCIYAGAYLASGRDMEATAQAVGRLFRLPGVVLPNSGDDRWLVAQRENGEILTSEAEIVELRSNARIASLFLLEDEVVREPFSRLSPAERLRYFHHHHKPVRASSGVLLALEQADIIVYSAGTQHSSLYPTYMSRGLAAAIADNHSALKVFITNIGADYETPQYRASDFLAGAARFLRLSDKRRYAIEELFSVMLINSSRIKADESYVDIDPEALDAFPVERVVDDFESREKPGRHDGGRIVAAILDRYESGVRRRLGFAAA
jgi:2-phospho-L-lactate transferase/gluconeogenesis factor (CofD/UPF0052 family)